MRIIETKVYTISEHPNKELCFDFVRENMHDLNEMSGNEVIDSLKTLSEVIGGTLDYSISVFPSRGEFISFKDYDKELLNELYAQHCPLTGCTFDADLIESMQQDGDAYRVLNALHRDTEYVYSDEGLTELFECNEYEFSENGEMI